MKNDASALPGDLSFALVGVGELQIGLPVQHVVHALPWPQALTRLPRTQGALAGVFIYRDLTVPLISLRQWLQLPDLPPPGGQVMVMRVGTRILGLGVDTVQGLPQVRADQIRQVHHDDRPEELFHSVAVPAEGQPPVSLLDPLRLMNQAAVWSEAAMADMSQSVALPEVADLSAGGTDTTDPGTAWAVVRTGAIVMACRAEDVGEVIPMPNLQHVFGSSRDLLGIARWRDRDLPVARILELLGLGAEPVESAPWMLVLGHQGRYIGLPVDEVRAVQVFPREQIQRSTDAGLTHPMLFEGLISSGQGEAHVLLNTEAIVARCPLHDISSPRSAPDSPSGSVAAPGVQNGDSAGQAHIVFRAGHAFAAVLQGMQEITAYPADSLRPGDTQTALVGTFDWRGRACALWDLRWLVGLGRSDVTSASRVMVAMLGGAVVGLLVDELLALLPAHQGEHTRFNFGPNLDIHMISVGQGDLRQSYRVLDLNTLPGLGQPVISS